MSQNYTSLAGLLVLCTTGALDAQNEHGDPYEPVGELTVAPLVVQPGVHPEMFWNIEFPEAVDDLVEVGASGSITTNKALRVKMRVAGVAFQSGTTQLPTALWIRVNGGSWQMLFYGRENDVNPGAYVYNQEHPRGTRLDFAARGKDSRGSWYSTRWTLSNMEEVIGLKNGDSVPNYAPAYDQGRIEDFLTQYLTEDNHVILGPRDMIYLFELASTNPGDWYFDLQDLSAVITFDEPDFPIDDGEVANAGEYVNFIRQTQQDSGVEWDVSVDADGTQLSPDGVSVDGSFFQLWSIRSQAVAEYLLDEQFVTSYTPNAGITILTGDPYQPVARTRVDQPFSVTFHVDGLLPAGPEVPLAAQQVAISHEAYRYPEGAHSLEGVDPPNGLVVQQGYLGENGSSTLGFTVTNLPGEDLTRAEGEEVFTVSALADYSVSAAVIDSKRLQVWPIARGVLSGFDSNHEYEVVPSVSVSLSDLYPSSATYVRVYPGPASSTPVDAKVVTASYVRINDSIPQDRALTLDGLDSYFERPGAHTLEILHETPFGVDLLHRASISVDRTVDISGALFTQD